jgi:hypothetical protein
MARVRCHRGLDRRTAQRGELALRTQVVLDVSRALYGTGIQIALELPEDLLVRLADNVGQHIEPAAVRHAHADFLEICFGGLLAHLVQQHDRRLAALQGEPLLSYELGLQECLEDLGLIELVEDPQVLLAWQGLMGPLYSVLDPLALRRLLNVHVLDADGPAIGITQDAQDLSHLHPALTAGEGSGRKFAIQVPQRQAV